MKTLKGWITTTSLATILLCSTMTVDAGIIIGGRTSQPSDPCTAKAETTKADDFGKIIIGVVTDIVVGSFTGIIIGGLVDQPQTNCGIIIGG